MKKFKSSLGALAIATLFFAFSSCSNGSDTPSALGGSLGASNPTVTNGTNGTTATPTTPTTETGTDSGNNNGTGGGTENGGGQTGTGQTSESGGAQLPPSVGTNELAGKTFNNVIIGDLQKFETSAFTSTVKTSCPSTAYNTAYILEITNIKSYTYDSNSKVIYTKHQNQKRESAIIRNGVRTALPLSTTISTDAEFIVERKQYFTIIYDLATNDYIETMAKQSRSYFSEFGYTDSTCETPVPNEIIEKFNETQDYLKLISPMSYSINDTGVKFNIQDCRLPKGKDFNELYNNYIVGLFLAIKDNSDNTAYGFYQFNGHITVSQSTVQAFTLPLASMFRYSNIMKSDGLLVYKISSVDANAIHTCATGTRANTSSDFTFTNESKTFNYTMTKSENGAVVDIEGLGKINIVYATPATIPDFTSLPEYTLQ